MFPEILLLFSGIRGLSGILLWNVMSISICRAPWSGDLAIHVSPLLSFYHLYPLFCFTIHSSWGCERGRASLRGQLQHNWSIVLGEQGGAESSYVHKLFWKPYCKSDAEQHLANRGSLISRLATLHCGIITRFVLA